MGCEQIWLNFLESVKEYIYKRKIGCHFAPVRQKKEEEAEHGMCFFLCLVQYHTRLVRVAKP
jgi:hypothetical protein